MYIAQLSWVIAAESRKCMCWSVFLPFTADRVMLVPKCIRVQLVHAPPFRPNELHCTTIFSKLITHITRLNMTGRFENESGCYFHQHGTHPMTVTSPMNVFVDVTCHNMVEELSTRYGRCWQRSRLLLGVFVLGEALMTCHGDDTSKNSTVSTPMSRFMAAMD